MDNVKSFLEFIKETPTAFHAIDKIKETLRKNNYIELQENRNWELEADQNYFVTRNNSSIIAFRLPENVNNAHFQIVATHSDSPTFKIKPNGIISSGSYLKLNTEKYGGMILSTWLDKPLGIAGRVFVKDRDVIKEKLVDLNDIKLVIPNVAIHQNREINTTFAYNPQVDLLPLLSNVKDKDLTVKKLIANSLEMNENDVLSFDLFLYNLDRGMQWGKENELISAPQIDNLECAYCSLVSFVEAEKINNIIPIYACFDNEEVGSSTKQGANSTFLSDILKRIHFAFSSNKDEYFARVANSIMVSADNAHSVHPNHPEKADLTNQVFMNEGIVIKSHASQAYTTDALSLALFTSVLDKTNVPYQYFTNRSDMGSGSTLGNISSAHVSIPCIDIGLAQLAMHSSYETAGAKDIEYMINGLKAFYQTSIEKVEGTYKI